MLHPVPRYPANIPDVRMQSPPQQQAAQAMPRLLYPSGFATPRLDASSAFQSVPLRSSRPQQLESRVLAPLAPLVSRTRPLLIVQTLIDETRTDPRTGGTPSTPPKK
ncbi:hypothetical protein PSHT_04946 [Puccinia striiformis]|uniref:Uncharacterized protein n=1 Tax=Puccinia striiformis TaxID=27350 RepID=A0A2S4WBV9_9BASI|nr:hypothetical protein PSHT_04946 [Puccinia striiformis]